MVAEPQLYSREQAMVLTVNGFYQYWRKLYHSPKVNLTREGAYDLTELLHTQLSGERKYSDFSSFNRSSRRLEK